jgi:hypothetical protein
MYLFGKLTIDWEGFDLSGNAPSDAQKENLYHYELATDTWQEKLMSIAKQAYLGCGGTGYGRVDIRTKNYETCDPFVLEVNSNCGMAFGGDSSSLGKILDLAKVDIGFFCRDLVDFALHRHDFEKPRSK